MKNTDRSLYTLRRPVFRVLKFSGIESIKGLCELAGTEAFSLTCDGYCLVLAIAGLVLEEQKLLCRQPDGKLVIMTVKQLNQEFEELT